MDKHTKGPWLLKEDGTIRSRDFEGSDMMGDYRGVIVCDLKPSVGCEDFQNIGREHAIPEMQANARLIAAAPELLTALQSAVEECHCSILERASGHLSVCPAPEWIDLIAKATSAQRSAS